MAVYLTNSMLGKFNRVKYPLSSPLENANIDEEHWQRLSNTSSDSLSKSLICRVCGLNGCTPITDILEGSKYNIMNAICSITNVCVKHDDLLPKYICTECLESLKAAMKFKNLCEVADRKFKKIANPMDDPSLHSYPYSKTDFQLILQQMKQKRMKREEERERERQKKERLLQKKNGPKPKQFKCSPCALTFPNKEKLTAHRHERQCMRRACELCGQLVLSIAQHMRYIHKQSILHKCTTCGKEFPVLARLKNHMMVHTNTFNFFCDLCPYKCKHKYYLVMHMRTHTGEKPYKCSECNSTFVNPSNLNKHKLTHQEKQFKCVMCEKAFRTTTALREHHEATHMNIKHTCNFCGRDFCYKSDLRKHEIKSHNRMKRDYIGGEPTYKQVERMQKIQETNDDMNKWQDQIEVTVQHPNLVQTTYIEEPSHMQPLYFTDVQTISIQPSQQLVSQQSLQLTLPELLKRDPPKVYVPPQGIEYF